MSASPTRHIPVRKVRPLSPQACLRRTPRLSAKYLYCVGTASAALGTAYLSGGLSLALQHGGHKEVAATVVQTPQETILYMTLRKQRTAPELPPVSEADPTAEAAPVAVIPPRAPFPAPPPQLAKESPPPKPKPAPVVSAQKSTFALKPAPKSPARAAARPPKTTAVADRDRPPERKPASVKSTAPSGSVAASRLDAIPRLLNSPVVAFPASVRRKGIMQGRAVLEVEIDTRGRVTVNRIIEISDSALESTARSFAGAARFTVPRRGGQPVRTVFRWPITLRL